MQNIKDTIIDNPYKNYMYSYPHKKSYREFNEKIDLKNLWVNRKNDKITLYIHIPFCKSKCGYCNLFSSTKVNKSNMKAYINTLVREMTDLKDVLQIKDECIFESVIFGGGTPTMLPIDDMKFLLESIQNILNVDFKNVFFSIETSPTTMNEEYMKLLNSFYINRISIGIQSFFKKELDEIYRFESLENIEKALDIIFENNIDIRNIDLIYGIPSQTIESFLISLKKALSYSPEEMFLYPLYIREKTKLYENNHRDTEKMLEIYKVAKKILVDNGYIQTSMRNFIRQDMKSELYPSYECQESEMIGLGCGARSYINNIHYSRKYAVKRDRIDNIIDEYIDEENFNYATYGYILSEDEMKRKYVIKSILKISGLDMKKYYDRFKTNVLDDFSKLNKLIESGYLILEGNRIYPSENGLQFSDSIGEMFISKEVQNKIDLFEE